MSVLITGGSGNLGGALVQHFLNSGTSVTTTSHLGSTPVGATSIAIDLSRPGSGEELALRLASEDFKVIIHNAADQRVSEIAQQDSQAIHAMLSTNLASIAEFTSAWARSKKVPESIIGISSVEAVSARPGHALYGASKAGLSAYLRTAAVELAPTRVNSIRLGLMDRSGLREQWPTGVQAWESAVPTRRMGTPADLIQAIEYLNAASWVTGTELVLDGGLSATAGW